MLLNLFIGFVTGMSIGVILMASLCGCDDHENIEPDRR